MNACLTKPCHRRILRPSSLFSSASHINLCHHLSKQKSCHSEVWLFLDYHVFYSLLSALSETLHPCYSALDKRHKKSRPFPFQTAYFRDLVGDLSRSFGNWQPRLIRLEVLWKASFLCGHWGIISCINSICACFSSRGIYLDEPYWPIDFVFRQKEWVESIVHWRSSGPSLNPSVPCKWRQRRSILWLPRRKASEITDLLESVQWHYENSFVRAIITAHKSLP